MSHPKRRGPGSCFCLPTQYAVFADESRRSVGSTSPVSDRPGVRRHEEIHSNRMVLEEGISKEEVVERKKKDILDGWDVV